MSYYDNSDDYTKRGIDYDLHACLENNEQDGFAVEYIKQVLAVWEGENDGDDWRWILTLKDGRFVFLQGSCDYTGWDCQSSAEIAIVDTIAEVLEQARNSKRFYKNTPVIVAHLANQLLGSKNKTWHQRTGEEMGLL
jgi:hypothetical protein